MSYPKRVKEEQEKDSQIRIALAKKHESRPCHFDPNEDLYDLPDYRGCFSKSLPHDHRGVADCREIDKMLDGVNLCWCSLEKINYPGSLRLVNPVAVYTYDLTGPYKACTQLPPVPRLHSEETAQEMIELYWMALLRDLPFKRYSTDSDAIQASSELKVAPEYLFRCGENGPYVSQFLLLPFSYGPLDVDQQYHCYPEGIDFMKRWEEALSCQNGIVKEPLPDRSLKRYMMTLRDGASYVHLDDLIQAGLGAMCILDRLRSPPGYTSQFPLWKADFMELMTMAAKSAMYVAWYHKWSICKVRPETVGIYLHRALIEGEESQLLHPQLLHAPVLNRTYQRFGSYLLPQAYPEGSPCHPSYPAGHSCFIGAIVTILKAFYSDDFMMDAFEPSPDGVQLIPTGERVRVGDELDKMTSNISMFRCGAGVHFRSDAKGIEVGETVAISLLKDYIKKYPFKVTFSFRKRDHTLIRITN